MPPAPRVLRWKALGNCSLLLTGLGTVGEGQRHPGQESATGALCSGLGNVCFQLWYFYTNDIESPKKGWNDKMQATATPRSLQSSVLALHRIKKVVPHVRRSEQYIFLICYQIWERGTSKTSSQKSKHLFPSLFKFTILNLVFGSSIPLKNTLGL